MDRSISFLSLSYPMNEYVDLIIADMFLTIASFIASSSSRVKLVVSIVALASPLFLSSLLPTHVFIDHVPVVRFNTSLSLLNSCDLKFIIMFGDATT